MSWFGSGRSKNNNEASGRKNDSSSSQPRVKIGDKIDGLKVTEDFVDKVDVKFQDDGKTNFDVGDDFKKVNVKNYHRDKKYDHKLVSQPQAEVSSNSTSEAVQIAGHVFIMNQEFKDIKRSRRVGSIRDVKSLEKSFGRFRMTPIVLPDLKYEDIVTEVDDLSKTDFSAAKLFVFVYMSHGDENEIVEAADRDFELEETIIEPILRNQTLSGVAKIFITVACRGDGYFEESDSNDVQTDGRLVSQKKGIDYANCIISYSTYKGHVSYRSIEGTYFIQHLCKNLDEANGDTKIHSVFTKVNSELNEFIQVPVFNSTMGDLSFKDLAST